MTISVRQWFRLSRAAQWTHDRNSFAADLHTLTQKVIDQRPLDRVESLGDYKLIFNREDWERHHRVCEMVRQQLQEAMEELEREALRRAALDYYAKDILQ